jgi:hypothetical protein
MSDNRSALGVRVNNATLAMPGSAAPVCGERFDTAKRGAGDFTTIAPAVHGMARARVVCRSTIVSRV